jgi:hypothetical protein
MRRVVLVVLGITLTGCRVLQDAFSAHPAAAAQANGQVLTVERLADLAFKIRGMALEPPNLKQLAGAYVNYSLFGTALASGKTLGDSSVIATVMWPLASQMQFEHYSDKRNAVHHFTHQQVDSAYNAGDVRAFQHILIMVPNNAAPSVVQQKQSQANTVWRSLVETGGTHFADMARRSSDDPASKASGGYLDVGARGRFVPQFEEAAWRLSPGAMSGLVRTNFGFHIIRRPLLAEIRDTFATGIEHIQAGRSDSSYFADLAKNHHIDIVSGAAPAIRSALQDLDAAGRSDKKLATYTGGVFAMKDFVRWLYAIDPRYAQMMLSANDSQLNTLLSELVQRSMALRQADSSGVRLSDSEWVEIHTQYDSTIAAISRQLNLTSAVLHDSGATDDARARLVTGHVNDYFDRVVAGEAQYLPIPPLLTQVLREHASWSIDPAAVQRAVERATALRASADSQRQPAAPMRPAAGPPPVGAPDSAR